MLKKLLAVAVIFGVGYSLGVYNGFKTAVWDVVENDGRYVARQAEHMYGPMDEPDDVPELSGDRRGFQ